jgi:hypothetical protein
VQEGENALVLALPIPPCVPAQASKGMTRSLSSMQEWQRQRDRKLEERRVAKEAAEAMSVRAAPVILKRSEAMVEAARRRQAQALASRWVHSEGAPLSVVVLCTWRVGTPKPSTTTIVAFGMYICGMLLCAGPRSRCLHSCMPHYSKDPNNKNNTTTTTYLASVILVPMARPNSTLSLSFSHCF